MIPTPTIVEALKAICSEFAQTHPLIIAARAALLRAEGESREGEPTLPHDVEVGPIRFRAGVKLAVFIGSARRWYAATSLAQPHQPTANVEEWVCPKCGAQADERFDCCEVHAETQHYAASGEAVARELEFAERALTVPEHKKTDVEFLRASANLGLQFVRAALTAQQHPGLGSGGPTALAVTLEALERIVEAGTRRTTVRIGDMYDLTNGYDDQETVSEEAEIAQEALDALAPIPTEDQGVRGSEERAGGEG